MPKLKVLKSVAHNLAHSYLSLMNYIDNEYTVERLFQIAKNSGENQIYIDVLNKVIRPEIYNTPEIQKSLIYMEKSFDSLINPEKITRDHIKSVEIKITFHLDQTRPSETVKGLELPSYDCISEITDINGKVHSKSVVEWWRY